MFALRWALSTRGFDRAVLSMSSSSRVRRRAAPCRQCRSAPSSCRRAQQVFREERGVRGCTGARRSAERAAAREAPTGRRPGVIRQVGAPYLAAGGGDLRAARRLADACRRQASAALVFGGASAGRHQVRSSTPADRLIRVGRQASPILRISAEAASQAASARAARAGLLHESARRRAPRSPHRQRRCAGSFPGSAPPTRSRRRCWA